MRKGANHNKRKISLFIAAKARPDIPNIINTGSILMSYFIESMKVLLTPLCVCQKTPSNHELNCHTCIA
jgi:hypothetical protein